jgi:PAS domain S-box-containing protein
MVLSRDQSVPVLYDLAMAMAGETHPRPLATAVLQRLLSHTGSACGAVLLHPAPEADVTSVTAEVYVAIGNPALRAMEGKTQDWPAWLLAGEGGEAGAGEVPVNDKYHHTLAFALPGLGHLLLFFRQAPAQAPQQQRLFAPILAKFARSLQHGLMSEANAQALQQSEARFRGMLESTSDWVWEVNALGAFTFSNNKIMDLLGYPPEEVLGKTLFDFMPPAEARHVGWTFRDIAASRRPFSGLENVNLHRHGHEVVLETSGVPIFDAAGNYLGYRGIDRDITARKQAQDALVQAKEDAEAASHAKTRFLSSISHELRTPLNAILGHAQLLAMQDSLPEPATTSAHEIMQAGNSLLALVNDVIELADLESGVIEIQTETLDVASVMDDCVAHNASAARLRRIPLDCATTCDCCQVMADRHYLPQVLNHLVANAIKYNHDGGQVRLACSARRNNRIRLSVTDTGPGISPADQAQLFVPFNRLRADKGQVGGAGIGLAISRRLVEAMSGSIGVDSPAGGGSTFWVELPATTANLECASRAQSPAPHPAGLQGARVLVAEDYVPNQTILQLQLTALGCQAEIAGDGAAALKKWRAGGHDLILADLNMPVMDGLALTRAVRAHEAGSGRHTPIICITAADQSAELRHCHEAGIDDVLAKPIALDALRSKLTRWLGAEKMPDTAAPEESGEAILDLDCLYQVLGEVNVDQGRTLVATFLRSAGEGLQQLASATEGAAVAREMHKQKSSARTVGAQRYAKLADALEQSAKQDGTADIAAQLTALHGALGEVEAAYAGLCQEADRTVAQPSPLSGHGTLLVIDDDPVVLQQMSAMLAGLGVKEVLTASNGPDALRLLSERNGSVEALVCDLNMPAMDGIELIRLFGRTGYRGGLILMSGADEKVLSTVGKLADLQGLRVLGQVQKPVTPEQMTGLLSRLSAPRARRRPVSAPLEASPQSIRDGIARDEFTVWFQPKVDADSLRPVGVEALARWQHPDHGILSPDVFIGVAEREGLVGELSQVLASKALMEGARLHEAGFMLSIAINLSGLWLDDLQLPDFIFATTQAAGLRPSDVILEVTETGVMKELTTALDVLTRLRLKGFELSIDDFGIGYSSFEQLDRIPFTELKLDRSFVNKGSTNATARAILQGSMDMARKMTLSTVAEGVETAADLELVRALGCERVQGYLIAAPMPTEDLIAWLRAGKTSAV